MARLTHGDLKAGRRLLANRAVNFPNWQTAKDYILGDAVVESGIVYNCIAGHTSSALFATDIANWQSHAGGAVSANITEGVLNNALAARTVPVNGQNLTFDNTNILTFEADQFLVKDSTGTIPKMDVFPAYSNIYGNWSLYSDTSAPTAAGRFLFSEASVNGANSVSMRSPDNLPASSGWILPADVPAIGEVLTVQNIIGADAILEWAAGAGSDYATADLTADATHSHNWTSFNQLENWSTGQFNQIFSNAGQTVTAFGDFTKYELKHQIGTAVSSLLADTTGSGATFTDGNDIAVALALPGRTVAFRAGGDAATRGFIDVQGNSITTSPPPFMRFFEDFSNGGDFFGLTAPSDMNDESIVWELPNDIPAPGESLTIVAVTGTGTGVDPYVAETEWSTGAGDTNYAIANLTADANRTHLWNTFDQIESFTTGQFQQVFADGVDTTSITNFAAAGNISWLDATNFSTLIVGNAVTKLERGNNTGTELASTKYETNEINFEVFSATDGFVDFHGKLGAGNPVTVRFYEDATNGTNYSAWQAPSLLAQDTVIKFPTDIPAVGEVLTITTVTGTAPYVVDTEWQAGSAANYANASLTATANQTHSWDTFEQREDFSTGNFNQIFNDGTNSFTYYKDAVSEQRDATFANGNVFDYNVGNTIFQVNYQNGDEVTRIKTSPTYVNIMSEDTATGETARLNLQQPTHAELRVIHSTLGERVIGIQNSTIVLSTTNVAGGSATAGQVLTLVNQTTGEAEWGDSADTHLFSPSKTATADVTHSLSTFDWGIISTSGAGIVLENGVGPRLAHGSGRSAYIRNAAAADAGRLRFWDNDNSNWIGIESPGVMAANTSLILPSDTAAAGEVLTVTSNVGNTVTLEWAAGAAGNYASSDLAADANYSHTWSTFNQTETFTTGNFAQTFTNGTVSADSGGSAGVYGISAGDTSTSRTAQMQVDTTGSTITSSGTNGQAGIIASSVTGGLTLLTSGGGASAGIISLEGFGGSTNPVVLRFREGSTSGSEFIGMKSPTALTTSSTWTLPSDAPAVGEVLTVQSVVGSDPTLEWAAGGGNNYANAALTADGNYSHTWANFNQTETFTTGQFTQSFTSGTDITQVDAGSNVFSVLRQSATSGCSLGVGINTPTAGSLAIECDYLTFQSDNVGSVGPYIRIEDATSDPTANGTDTHLYNKGGEMFVADSASNFTQISPHDDKGEWIFYSENKRTGKRIKIDMERFFKEQFPEYVQEG